MEIVGYIKLFVSYGIPILALIISISSYIDSRKTLKVQSRLSKMEERLKKYELDEKEKEREESNKACVEARVYKISKGNYSLKIWNSGKATAYNVDFIIPEKHKGIIFKDKVPFEVLEPGKSFDEKVIVYAGTPSKFNLKTIWSDNYNDKLEKEQIVTI